MRAVQPKSLPFLLIICLIFRLLSQLFILAAPSERHQLTQKQKDGDDDGRNQRVLALDPRYGRCELERHLSGNSRKWPAKSPSRRIRDDHH